MHALRPIFSAHEIREACRALKEAFRTDLTPGEAFTITGSATQQGVTVSIELADEARTSVTRWQAAYALAPSSGSDEESGEAEADMAADDIRSLVAVRHGLVAFLTGYLESWFADERWPRPHLDWKTYTFGPYEFALRGETLNEALERMADELLAADDDGEAS